MDNNIANILGQLGLPSEVLAELQEAFDAKVAAASEEQELALREDFARRYEHDKNNLIESMDRMVTDAIQKFEGERAAEVTGLIDARTKFQEAAADLKSHYTAKLKEHAALIRQHAVETVSSEVIALRKERAALAESSRQVKAELEAIKEAAAAERAAHISRIDEFVVRQVTGELAELKEDHDALIASRARLVAEGKKAIQETQKKLVKEASARIDAMVTNNLKAELAQLHEDIERNRENNFGRRIFEAVAAEYITSGLSEGTELRKLTDLLAESRSQLEQTKNVLTETAREADAAKRKARLAESRAERKEIMSELLTPLKGEKRAVMESLLETVQTPALRKAFKQLLPTVLNEQKTPASAAKQKLSEGEKKTSVVTVTGDRTNRLNESAKSEPQSDHELDVALSEVARLAGINK